MTILTGAVIGLLAGAGLLLAVISSPPLRRQTLADRIAPYLRDAPAPSRLLGDGTPAAPGIVARLTAPLLADLVRLLDKVVGGRTSIARRLAALGSPMTVEQFRAEQVMWAGLGTGAGLATVLLAVISDHRSPILLILLVMAGALSGVLARDWWLTQTVSRRDAEMLSEFPAVAEMLALAVTAGESPSAALSRVCRLTQGHLADQLSRVLADTRAGAPLQQALLAARDHTALEPLARFLDGMAVAIERGTPLAEVLHAQSADVRALRKRQLLETGGKKEIAMMVPVVFLIMPITILFAFFPGLIAITTVAQ